jgi:hypothetical protein
MGWGNSAHFAIRNLERFWQTQGNHEAGGSTARSGLLGLETVEKKKSFCKTPGVLPGGAFSFLDEEGKPDEILSNRK